MEELALFGGPVSVTAELSQTGLRPLVSVQARLDIDRMLQNGEISISPMVGKFERAFADYIGAKYTLCACNGTTVLQEALFAVGIQPGDEVIVPSYTFWATVAPIVAAHGKPVFCDVDEKSYTIDPNCIEKLITPRTKAIMLVHVWGVPCDMDRILEIARKHNLAVIEDCAHAHGAMYHGKKVGTFGDVAMFSLQGSKVMTAGEGGVLVTNNRTYYERAVSLGHYERIGSLPPDSEYRQYALTGLGFKHRMHPLGAAIAYHDLMELDQRNDIRDTNGAMLDAGIADLPFISQQAVLPDTRRLYSYHYARYHADKLMGIKLTTILTALKAEGLTIGVCGYGRLHKAPLFVKGSPYGDGCPCSKAGVQKGTGCAQVELPVTERLAEETFFMAPRFENKCPELIQGYIHAYHKIAENAEKLLAYEQAHMDETVINKNVSGTSINLF